MLKANYYKLYFSMIASALSCLFGTLYATCWPAVIVSFSIFLYLIIYIENFKLNPYKYIFLWGVMLYSCLYYWVFFPILQFNNNSIPIALLISSVFIILCAQLPLIIYFITKKTGSNYFFLPRLIIIWGISEWLISLNSISFPWFLIGYSMTKSPLIALAPYGGVYLVSIATLLIALLCVKALNNKNIITNVNIIFIIFASCIIISKLPSWTNKNSNIDVAWLESNKVNKWQTDNLQQLIKNSNKINKADLIIWPEGALNWVYEKNPNKAATLKNWVKKHKTPILTGIFHTNKQNMYNSALLQTIKNKQLINKNYLVPFGEYIPLKQILMPIVKKMQIPMSQLTTDKRPNIINLYSKKLAIIICYEIAFPKWVWQNSNISQAIITITDDHWFNSELAIKEHLNILKMRVAETQKEGAFINTNGLSQIVHLSKKNNNYKNKLFLRIGETPITKFGFIPILIILICMIIISNLKSNIKN